MQGVAVILAKKMKGLFPQQGHPWCREVFLLHRVKSAIGKSFFNLLCKGRKTGGALRVGGRSNRYRDSRSLHFANINFKGKAAFPWGGGPLDWDRSFIKCFLDALAPLDFKLSVSGSAIYYIF